MDRDAVRAESLRALDVLPRYSAEDAPSRSRRDDSPPTDIYTEDDGALVIETHLPNFQERDITVTVESNSLIIDAEEHDAPQHREYLVRETPSSFSHTITLPERFAAGRMSADFSRGVLRLRVPLADVLAPWLPPEVGT